MLVRNWRWTLVVAVALVAVVVAGVLIWTLSPKADASAEGPGVSPSPTVSRVGTPTPGQSPSSSPTGSPSVKASPPPTAPPAPGTPRAATLVDVDALGLPGRPRAEAEQLLVANGLAYTTLQGGWAMTPQQVGTVLEVGAHGSASLGTVVPLYVYGDMFPLRIPPEPWVVDGDHLAFDVPAGTALRIYTLREETCDGRTGMLTGHTFTADRGRFSNGERQITTSEPTADVAVPLTVDADAAGQKLNVRVASICSAGAGNDRVSDFSQPKIVSIVAP